MAEPTEEIDVTGLLSSGVPTGEVVDTLAAAKNFDSAAARADLINYYRNTRLSEGFTEAELSDEVLAERANEDLLIELSGGKFVREEDPVTRGIAKGLMVDTPVGMGMAFGAQRGYRLGMAAPLPPQYKIPLVAATTMGGAALGAITPYIPGEFAFNQFFEGEDVIPSQRPTVEAARTAAGTVGTLAGLPIAVTPGSVNFGSYIIARNIQRMSGNPIGRTILSLLEKGTRLLEKGVEAVARPFAKPTSVREGVTTAAKMGAAAAAPAAGAYVAEKIDPYDPWTRVGAEVGSSVLPWMRLVGAASVGTVNKFKDWMSSLTASGRIESTKQQLVETLGNLSQRYNMGELDIDEFRTQLMEAVNNSELDQLVKEINENLPPSERIIRPPLTIAQQTGDVLFSALERGARNSNAKTEGGITFAEESARRQQDFLVFANRFVEQLILQSSSDPSALKAAAEVQEAIMRERLLYRLDAAMNAAKGISDKVKTPLERQTLSEQIVTQVEKAYEEATDTGNRLYDRAKQEFPDAPVMPQNTLEALQTLQTERVGLSGVLNQLFNELVPDREVQSLAVERLGRQVEAAFDELSKTERRIQKYFVENPRVASFLRDEMGIDVALSGQDPQAGSATVAAALETLAGADAPRTQVARQAESALKRMNGYWAERQTFDNLNTELGAARDGLTSLSASEISLQRLLDYKSRLGKLQREKSPNPNQAQEVFDAGEVEEALINDLEALTDSMDNPRLNALREANSFHRAKHDVFTRTFAFETRRKTSRGGRAVDPKLFATRLFSGNPDEVSVRLQQIQDAVNFINNPRFQPLQPVLDPEELASLQETAVARVGTYAAAELDVFKSFLRNVVDDDPNSPTYGIVKPDAAQAYITKNREALQKFFPAVFQDLQDAVNQRRSVEDIRTMIDDLEKELNATSILFSKFSGIEDTPGNVVGSIIGSPGNRPPNAIKNFRQLLNELNATTEREGFDPAEAKDTLAKVILDRAWQYAGGARSDTPLNLRKFRDFLYRPLNDKDGPSVANLLEQEGLLTKEEMRRYQVLLNQAEQIATVMERLGPQNTEVLVDKGYILGNILTRAAGAIGGNVLLNRLKGLIGNVPGASMSVAGTTADAAAKLGLAVPQSKIRDLFIEAFLNPELADAMLRPPPRTKRQLNLFLQDIPAIIESAVGRFVQPSNVEVETPLRPQLAPRRTTAEVIREQVREQYSPTPPERSAVNPPVAMAPQSRPTALGPMAPPAPPPAAPNPQQRAQYAAMFPYEPTSELIRGGIGSLG